MSTETDELASAAKVEQKAVPSLPAELQRHILLLALPRVSFATFKARYRLLCTASLVNRAWRTMALREMIRHPFLRTPKQEEAFFDVACEVDPGFSAKDEDETAPKGWIESVWMKEGRRWSMGIDLGDYIPYPVDAWVYSGSGGDPIVIHPHITALYSISCCGTIELPRGQSNFSLRTLAVCEPWSQTPLPFKELHAAQAPLTSLILLDVSTGGFLNWPRLTDATEPFLPHLISFVLHAPRSGLPEPTEKLLSHLRSIRHLDFALHVTESNDSLVTVDRLISALPSTAKLISLRIKLVRDEAYKVYFPQILETIRASPPALSNLKRLILPVYLRPRDDGKPVLSWGVPKGREELKDVCRARGVAVIDREETFGFEEELREIREEIAWTESCIGSQ